MNLYPVNRSRTPIKPIRTVETPEESPLMSTAVKRAAIMLIPPTDFFATSPINYRAMARINNPMPRIIAAHARIPTAAVPKSACIPVNIPAETRDSQAHEGAG
jgi:hypothetical protein